MKLLEILKKTIMPNVLIAISLDSYRRLITNDSDKLSELKLEKTETINKIQTEL
jgi:hypothetical protein